MATKPINGKEEAPHAHQPTIAFCDRASKSKPRKPAWDASSATGMDDLSDAMQPGQPCKQPCSPSAQAPDQPQLSDTSAPGAVSLDITVHGASDDETTTCTSPSGGRGGARLALLDAAVVLGREVTSKPENPLACGDPTPAGSHARMGLCEPLISQHLVSTPANDSNSARAARLGPAAGRDATKLVRELAAAQQTLADMKLVNTQLLAHLQGARLDCFAAIGLCGTLASAWALGQGPLHIQNVATSIGTTVTMGAESEHDRLHAMGQSPDQNAALAAHSQRYLPDGSDAITGCAESNTIGTSEQLLMQHKISSNLLPEVGERVELLHGLPEHPCIAWKLRNADKALNLFRDEGTASPLPAAACSPQACSSIYLSPEADAVCAYESVDAGSLVGGGATSQVQGDTQVLRNDSFQHTDIEDIQPAKYPCTSHEKPAYQRQTPEDHGLQPATLRRIPTLESAKIPRPSSPQVCMCICFNLHRGCMHANLRALYSQVNSEVAINPGTLPHDCNWTIPSFGNLSLQEQNKCPSTCCSKPDDIAAHVKASAPSIQEHSKKSCNKLHCSLDEDCAQHFGRLLTPASARPDCFSRLHPSSESKPNCSRLHVKKTIYSPQSRRPMDPQDLRRCRTKADSTVPANVQAFGRGALQGTSSAPPTAMCVQTRYPEFKNPCQPLARFTIMEEHQVEALGMGLVHPLRGSNVSMCNQKCSGLANGCASQDKHIAVCCNNR